MESSKIEETDRIDEEDVVSEASTNNLLLHISANTDDRPVDLRGVRTKIVLGLISLLWMLVFGYSAAVQYNDKKAGVWTAFYTIHALIPLFTLASMFAKQLPGRPILFLSLAMSIWSLVFVGMASVRLLRYDRNNVDDSNTPNTVGEITYGEQLSYEVAGGCLTLVSAIYHTSLVKRCIILPQRQD